ncbi:CDP-diacylglycerol--glycerol-3-phosphate 3-phosphatidyltransferase [bacterium]|nr:CDP-diacylglycerol--glycerol-3-phosphate 3-phosphatidyltransferase [bacterium]MBU1153899.1 CDP-diacylglycerol--glycerol-3-phosphate 3-phosphatidyltransferase [bacterium]MBU1781973.1 CDP-diacylglycerol--glycerol-3-phosphate 3-phosphatidyltransferase [bacterium]
MSVANILTLTRVLLVPPFLYFISCKSFFFQNVALFIFILAAVTDMLDGYFARRNKIITNWGKFMDPLADKILISAAFISFVSIPSLYIPAWMVVLIISREFIITGLRLIASNEGTVVAASMEGKVKTTSQIITIIAILLLLTFKSYLNQDNIYQSLSYEPRLFIEYIFHLLPYSLVLATTFFTLYSGVSYLIEYKDLVWDLR